MQRAPAGIESEIAMIRPLRQRHRRIVITLGVSLPIVFIVGIAARSPVPSMASLLLETPTFSRASAATVWDRPDLFSKETIHVRLLRASGNSSRFALELSAAKDFVKPDLIVYWIPGNSEITGKLPDNALLLGTFSSSALSLPANAASETGALVLYCLANNEIVDVTKPVRFADSNN